MKTIQDFIAMKQKNDKIVMLTCYDSSMSKILSKTDIDMILVGDSVGMTKLGYENTLSVTMDDMVRHTKAVKNGNYGDIFIVADMPYMSYENEPVLALENAKRLINAGANAVKLEGGSEIIDSVKEIISAGIPIVGHLGMTPQSVEKFGGFKVQCRDDESAKKLLTDSLLLQEAGVFCIVFECIPEQVAKEVSSKLSIPVIGIGAGKYCDGQVLVSDDMLGMFSDFKPKFVKRYAELNKIIYDAVQQYGKDVKSGNFPKEENTYK